MFVIGAAKFWVALSEIAMAPPVLLEDSVIFKIIHMSIKNTGASMLWLHNCSHHFFP